MVVISCQVEGCKYSTQDIVSEQLLSQLLRDHREDVHASLNADRVAKQTRAEKLRRPSVSLGCSREEWMYFKSRWMSYKGLANLNGDNIVAHLLECCEEDLRKDLFRTYGIIEEKTENEALDAIYTQAVRTENTVVARVSHIQMKQDRDEPVRKYVSRLKGQAGTCNYTLNYTYTCDCKKVVDISYSDDMVRNVLASGLENMDIQADLLGDTNQNMTLSEMVTFIEAKETGKTSASRLTSTNAVNAVRSSYKREARHTVRHQAQARRPHTQAARDDTRRPITSLCSYCGRQGHGNHRDPAIRRKRNCPAFDQRCSHCNFQGHFEKMCYKKHQTRQTTTAAIESDKEDDGDHIGSVTHSDQE